MYISICLNLKLWNIISLLEDLNNNKVSYANSKIEIFQSLLIILFIVLAGNILRYFNRHLT